MSTLGRALIAALLLAPVVVGSGCGSDSGGRFNLILISIDTLRADRLGQYGYHRDTSPFLDELGRRGLVFERAVAECSWTVPSHVTMLTGLFPSTHGVHLPTQMPGPETRLLAEILADRDYRTIGLTDGGYMIGARGFDRGFEIFDEEEKGLEESIRRATGHLEAVDPRDRFFLFLHTYDVHCPYSPSPEFAKQFRSTAAEFIETDGKCGNPDFNTMVMSDGQRRFLSDQYDASIREADASLGRFFEFLDSSGLFENTVIIVTSDHGEEFGEYGQIGHERTLHREVLMIPLLVVAPGIPPARVPFSAGLVDLPPTALDLLEIAIPDDMEGKSLLAGSAEDPARPREDEPRISELGWKIPMKSVMTRDRHLIVNLKTDQSRLYDVSIDTTEIEDLAGGRPEEVTALRRILAAYDRERRPREPEAIKTLPPEQVDRLRNLGYVN